MTKLFFLIAEKIRALKFGDEVTEMETIYIETTVVSYLVANLSRDSILAAHQQLTRQWWQDERQRYKCVTSEEVLREAASGDAEMSRRRAEALAGMTVFLVDDTARSGP